MNYIKTHENFLSDKLFHNFIKYSDFLKKSLTNNFRSNYSWPQYIVMDSAPIFIHNIDDKSDLFREFKEEINTKLGIDTFFRLMMYVYTPGSHIPIHDDGSYKGSLTIILNDEWNISNGGLFHYFDNDEIRTIVPKRNLGIEQRGHVQHFVSCLTRNSPFRLTVQAFVAHHKDIT